MTESLSDPDDPNAGETSDQVAEPVFSAETRASERLDYFRAVERHLEERASRTSAFRTKLAKPILVALVVSILAIVGGLVSAKVLGGSEGEAEPTVIASGIFYCEVLDKKVATRLEHAIGLMRSKEPGTRLVDVLIDNSVCFDIDDLQYKAAYFSSLGEDEFNGRSFYFIVIDRGMLMESQADELAALLIHEATHAERRINDQDCEFKRNCTYLSNEVALEEEVATHSAEAEWWMAVYGEDGTRTGVSYSGTAASGYLNQLLYAYLKGPESFEAYVRMIRSSGQEGEGIELPPFLEGGG